MQWFPGYGINHDGNLGKAGTIAFLQEKPGKQAVPEEPGKGFKNESRDELTVNEEISK